MFSDAAYRAARQHAAFIDRSDRGRLIVSGADRAAYLHNLFTNDIARLPPGHGCYAAYLTAHGRMIADLYVYELGDLILLALARAVKDTVLARLEQFVFSEDVKLEDASDTFSQIAVVGPAAATVAGLVLQRTSRDALTALPEHGNLRVAFAGQSAIVTRITDTGEPGYDIYVERTGAAGLTSALVAAGAVEMNAETAEVIRIEAGVPLFGRDMDGDTFPLEAGIEARAISFTKGCYVGQEVIARIHRYGHGRVQRKLVGLEMDEMASAPPAGTIVHVDEREVGRVTSSARSPRLGRAIALGYVHRDFVAPGTELSIEGARAVVIGFPVAAPPGTA
jgi:tRNA-modifying protein YgfZ